MTTEDFTLENSRKKIDQFKADLERMVPDPVAYRLIELDKEYTPTELRDLLQHFSSYLATLYAIEGSIEAEYVIVKEGFKTGLSLVVAEDESKATLTAKQANVLANNVGFREVRKMQIHIEAQLALLHGWIRSYESAYQGVSRIVTLVVGEASLNTGRFP